MAGQILIRTLGAFFAVVSFSFLLELPKRFVAPAGIVGGLGWLVYLLLDAGSGSAIMAAFVSSLMVAWISHLFSRWLKAPVTVFLVAGILPSVPGSSIYRCVYYMILSQKEMSTYYLLETLQIAGAIAMAIFMMDSLFQLGRKRKTA